MIRRIIRRIVYGLFVLVGLVMLAAGCFYLAWRFLFVLR